MNWFNRRFRDAPNEMLSESTGDLGDFHQHLGDWCEGRVMVQPPMCRGWVPVDNPEATLVTSMLLGKPHEACMHAPVLDLDLEHVYYESTTPGHAALLLNVELSWDQYRELLEVLHDCGIIETGFYEASIQRGYSACRTPWTKKIVERQDQAVL